MKNFKYKQQKKHKLVSKIPGYHVILLKLMMEWKWTGHVEQKKKKKTGSSSTQILG